MLKWKLTAKAAQTPYASSADFCRIFHEQTESLFLLSLLLTADNEKAEECFVQSFEDAAKGTTVFKEWAHCWARRKVIQNALRKCELRPTGGNPVLKNSSGSGRGLPAEMAAIFDLPVFARFVFVLSVLEHLSDHECSLLLVCSRRELIAARSLALQRIASVMIFDREEAAISAPHMAGFVEM
jgi:DNA-directed RNA polymerase specialized sigma24 family protein